MTVSLRRASYGQWVSYLYTHLPLVFHYIKIRKEAVLKMETMEPVKEDRTNGKEQNPPTEKSADGSSNLQVKIVFVCACVTIVILSNAVISSQWMIPYIYAGLAPVLFSIRIVTFWREKLIYFLVDFCYSVHVHIAVFLCMSMPLPPYLFAMLFAFANGPVLASTLMFKDWLQLHRLDKLTNNFLHIFPALLTFCVRWYPDEVSKYWFKELVSEVPPFSLVWLYVAPLTYIACYCALYTLIVLVIINPSAEYQTVYTAVCKRGFAKELLNRYGKRFRYLMFILFLVTGAVISLIFSVLNFCFFEFNCISLTCVLIYSTWSGASIYTRHFSGNDLPAEKKSSNKVM